ncbi:MAG: efflux RND transporter periplasmic adaptor subunit [Gammaproteobacteria bacterium]|nr:efflux RND transporter periplasmic adaptor subunit [Gammaproteobacteria bacterium]MBU1653521.1 efflux RND transporter periplasmic adaptor subunit [Gammaproteobacteria bacterium]MBU1962550.1 efflux RND transporter periplasmic adaptor subunit [Gammaproteobacteria bacterium]
MQPRVIVALSLVLALGSAGIGAEEILTVESQPAQSQDVVGGTVIPFKTVTLTAQRPGRVHFIAGEEGAWLPAGQLLVSLSDDQLQAQRSAAMNQLNNSQVQYNKELVAPQSSNINRMPGMGLPGMFDQMFTRYMGSNMGYGNPWVERGADLHSSGSQVAQAASQVGQIDAMVRDGHSISPFEGLIARKLVEVGDTVQPGQALLEFIHVRFMRIEAQLPARLVSHLTIGGLVEARLDNGESPIQARVAEVAPIADPVRHTVRVRFDLPQGARAAPGMYAQVQVPDGKDGPEHKSLLIPRGALIYGGNLPQVMKLGEDGSPRMRVVRLGGDRGDDKVTVLSGLAAGDRILANPSRGK